jgi:protein-tyrosine phosphatase
MFDPQDQVLDHYLANQVNTVVVLNPAEEHLRYSGKDLLTRYAQAGLRVIYAPVADFSVPDSGHWDKALQEAVSAVKNGENLAVHCHAGVGRTGMFAAMMAHELLGTNADESIAWVRRYIPFAIDTDYQKRFVREHIQRTDL